MGAGGGIRRRWLWGLAGMVRSTVWRRGGIRAIRDRLGAALRMIRAYATGQYRVVAPQRLMMLIGSVVYLIWPLDFIPDFLPGGLLDDAAMLAFVLRLLDSEITDFLGWERSQGRAGPQFPYGQPIPAHPVRSYPVQSYPVQSYPIRSYPGHARSAQVYPTQAYPAPVHPATGFPIQGYPAQVHPAQSPAGPAWRHAPAPGQLAPAPGPPAPPFRTTS